MGVELMIVFVTTRAGQVLERHCGGMFVHSVFIGGKRGGVMSARLESVINSQCQWQRSFSSGVQ